MSNREPGHRFTFVSKGTGSFPYAAEIRLEEDASLEEVLRGLETYLRAAGFEIHIGDYLVIDNDMPVEEEDFEELMQEVDDELTRIVNNVSSKKHEGKNENK